MTLPSISLERSTAAKYSTPSVGTRALALTPNWAANPAKLARRLSDACGFSSARAMYCGPRATEMSPASSAAAVGSPNSNRGCRTSIATRPTNVEGPVGASGATPDVTLELRHRSWARKVRASHSEPQGGLSLTVFQHQMPGERSDASTDDDRGGQG